MTTVFLLPKGFSVFIIETIYPGDSDNSSLDFKLVRFVRTFRAESLLKFRMEVRIQGYFATNPDYDSAKANAERADLRRRMTEIEDKIVGMGIARDAIYRVGVSQSTLSGGQIVLTNGSALDLTLPYFVPTVPLAPSASGPPSPPGPAPAGTRPTWIDSEASITGDPKDKEINTEVKVTFMAGGLLSSQSLSVTMVIGADGTLKEAGGDLKLKSFKAKIVDEWSRGIITDVKFSIKLASSYDMQRDTEEKERLKTKLKGVLEADIGIPNTQFRIGAEAGAYIDTAGKPGMQLNFTLFKF